MDTQPPAPDPATQHDQDVQHHRALLNTMIDIGASFVSRLHDRAQAADPVPTESPTAFAAAYDRATRSIRRSILLVHKLTEPRPAAALPTAQRHFAVRQRIIRDVEDVIQRHFSDEDEESLHAELLDRMDGLDVLEDIDSRPVAAIVLDLCRDLGLESMPGNHPWTRRRPADIAVLRARAAGDRVPGGSPYPRTGRVPPLTDDELVDILLPGGRRCR